ncbi:MAG: ABC transporter permease [Anaerovorax sp.]
MKQEEAVMEARELGMSIIKKIIQLVLALFVLSILVFFMSRLAPGDPLRSYYGDSVERMSVAQQEDAKERLGLKEPLLVQYGSWLKNAASGEFGISYKYKQDVVEVVKKMGGNTLILGGLAFILTFALALPLGIFCALREETLADRMICKLGVVTSCVPSFFVALVFILIFAVNLGWVPTSGAYGISQESDLLNRMYHLILPVAVLVLGHLWYYAYMVRNKLIEETRQDYVLLCKVKGLGAKQIMWKHCLRNTMPSFISLMAISLPHILGGTYIVEKVFSYPGLGTITFESAQFHDYNMLMVICLLTGALVILGNMIAQLINEVIDPRMRVERYEGRELL